MNFGFYKEKLENSEEFKSFYENNPSAFFCSAFFLRDLESLKDPKHQTHMDYFVPEKNKIFSFKLDNGIELVPTENFSGVPSAILFDKEFDFDIIEDMVREEMSKNAINNKIQKMIFSMQHFEDNEYLFGTVFLSSMGLLKVNFNLSEMKITDFEKKSFFDVLNIFKK